MTLEDVRAHIARAAILLDFDGTLAPIVEDPAAALPVAGAAPALHELATRAADVVIITGRPAAFVRDALDVPEVEVIGLYGLTTSKPVGPGVLQAIRDLIAPIPGTALEDKGASVAVHVRRAADPDGAAAVLRPTLQELADRHDLAIFEGKRVIELAPRGARKAGAVRAVLERTRPAAALYAGDDAEDAEAFAALAEAGIPMCRVAVTASGTPDCLIEIADVHVEGPEALVALLRTL